MATVAKRTWKTSKGESKTAWVVRYTDQLGKPHIKTFRTKKAADDWETTVRNEVRQGTHTPASTSSTVAEAAQRWYEQAETDGLERSTLRLYEGFVRLHIVPLLGSLKLSSLTVDTVNDFRKRLLAGGHTHLISGKAVVAKSLSRDRARVIVVFLGAILDHAIMERRLAHNVVRAASAQNRRHTKLAKRHKKQLEVGEDIPTPAELNTIIKTAQRLGATQEPWKALIITVTFTGLRASELRGLRWKDIDLDRAELTVRQRADPWNTMGSPKSNSSKRTIPLAPMVVTTLREWFLACPKGELGLVFPDEKGAALTHGAVSQYGLGALQQAAGLCRYRRPPKYAAHAFRHACASLLIADGHNAKWIQHFMGHASIQETFNTYGHLFPDEKDGQKAVLEMQQRVLGQG